MNNTRPIGDLTVMNYQNSNINIIFNLTVTI